MERFDAIIIGGGATGAEVTRDLTLRGLKTVLLERHDLSSGTSGRLHGLLHSGGRYVVKDKESARECAKESKILLEIASNSVHLTGGLFVGISGIDDPEYKDQFIQGCRECNVETKELSPKEALQMEPFINEDVESAFYVNDGSAYPFRLIVGTALQAAQLGASIRTYSEIIALHEDNMTITGVRVKDQRNGNIYDLYADFVINATGVWAGEIAKLADIHIPMTPSKGVMVVIDRRLFTRVVNRLRFPANGDIIVPHISTAIIGTTSVSMEDPDQYPVTVDEVNEMIREGAVLSPFVKEARMVRAYAGNRPLFGAEPGEEGREISRTFKVLDHEIRDGVSGLITITGGKFTTYRLMAEKTADLVAKKLGIRANCVTHKTKLPGAEEHDLNFVEIAKKLKIPWLLAERTIGRWGAAAKTIFANMEENPAIRLTTCSCEYVSNAEVKYTIDKLWAYTLEDICKRTQAGFGICQGGLCTLKLAYQLFEYSKDNEIGDTQKAIIDFIEERWKGTKFVLWMNQLRQELLNQSVFSCVGNYDHLYEKILESRQ
ncbi:MAG: anaerobic glycerol-3-phosphate dehydrogenase subunit GlpA [Promethearchaeota archaeon]